MLSDCALAEQELLGELSGAKFQQRLVEVCKDVHINTLEFEHENNGPTLILVHGYGSGVGQWVKNYEHLSKHYKVYACDMIGFGLSTRPEVEFSGPEEAETFLVHHLAAWLTCLGLDTKPFMLAGHSLGAYVATAFQLKYNHACLQKLILVDPWGFPLADAEKDDPSIISKLCGHISPFAILRWSGPLAKSIMAHFRPDLITKFSDAKNPEVFLNYYHRLNQMTPATGDDAFQALRLPLAWARLPLVQRFEGLGEKLDVTFIYGSETHYYVDINIAYSLQKEHTSRPIAVHVIDGAGHHVMIDRAREFNELMATLAGSNVTHNNDSEAI